MATVESLIEDFESLLPWERAEVVRAFCCLASEYGVDIPDDDDDDDDDDDWDYDAFDAVWKLGAEELLEEIDVYDIIKYFRERPYEWDDVKKGVEDDATK